MIRAAAAVVMALLLFTTCEKRANTAQFIGAGTIEDPFQVDSVAALKKIGTVTDGWTLIAHYKQTADIIFADEDGNWTPIGGSNDTVMKFMGVPFSGSYDGNGFTIANLTINAATDAQGLFRAVASGGLVKNVGLINCSIISTGENVGGLAGINNGTVENSYVTGNVSGNNYLGGLIGNNSGAITDCYTTCYVSGREYAAGGLVGDNHGAITNSYALGSVSGDNAVGGLVGENSGAITNSYATGNISGDNNVGGVLGLNNSGAVLNSNAAGNVSGSNLIGGLVGQNSYGSIENSYTTGDVSGSTQVGGLVGHNYGSRAISIVKNSYASGNVSGENYVGGVVGHNYGIVENCVALNGGITRKSGTSGRFGRVIGYWYKYRYEDGYQHEYNDNVALINNFARSNISFIDGTIISRIFPVVFDSDNGAGITAAHWSSSNWWTETAQWDDTVWDFSGVGADSYPRLR